ncbi:hypothetical protein [Bradyrhizobium sp.]|uniref:hypothetical protein n=1 Tax=Bradyrhizobium sp. TaxID=376 RepID=UPI002635273B|nr:hypothetical protein [Bradyrhizobium sp.]
MQGFLLQVEVSKIILHEADQPNAVVGLPDVFGLADKDLTEIDFLSIEADVLDEIAAHFIALGERDDVNVIVFTGGEKYLPGALHLIRIDDPSNSSSGIGDDSIMRAPRCFTRP